MARLLSPYKYSEYGIHYHQPVNVKEALDEVTRRVSEAVLAAARDMGFEWVGVRTSYSPLEPASDIGHHYCSIYPVRHAVETGQATGDVVRIFASENETIYVHVWPFRTYESPEPYRDKIFEKLIAQETAA